MPPLDGVTQVVKVMREHLEDSAAAAGLTSTTTSPHHAPPHAPPHAPHAPGSGGTQDGPASNWLLLGAFFMLIIGIALSLAGVAADNWIKIVDKNCGSVETGLFQKCGSKLIWFAVSNTFNHWWLGCQTLALTGATFYLIPLFMSPFYFSYLCTSTDLHCLQTDWMSPLIAATMFLAGVLLGLCVTIFYKNADDGRSEFGWGWVLTAMSSVLAIVIGTLILAIRSQRIDRAQQWLDGHG